MANRGEVATIAVVGAGTMGRGIIQLAAEAGLAVIVHDTAAGAAGNAVAFVGRMIGRAVEKGRLRRDQADAAIGRITLAEGLAELAPADIVVEAIIERLDAKQALFRELEGIVGDDCILATNTSSLPVTAVAAACRLPARVAGLHFFNPAPLMKVVEVIPGLRTAPATRDRLVALVEMLGHRPVVVADTPGFLINHAGRGLTTEGLRIVQEGIAEPVDVDRVMRDQAGFRMGPFELLDLTGLDVSHAVLEQIYGQFHHEPRYRPSPLPGLRVAAGLLGRKTGEGFYRYVDGRQVVPDEPAPPADAAPMPVWVSPAAPERADRASRLLTELGVPLDTAETAGPGSLCLVTPLGADATTSALREGLDPTRTLALDTLMDLSKRRTLMPTPVTEPALRDAAAAMLGRGGARVTMIHDSPGFIAQRILAQIVNIGCEIAQQRIAAPDDIDAGVRLGLGYPAGPLALGDRIGAGTVLTILDELYRFYGDPRYRPSPWLKRRALLGVPLSTPEA